MVVIFRLLLLLLCCGTLPAQTDNALREVVSKTIENTYKYSPGRELAVEGEKAEIFVETWDRREIHVKIVMTARHADLDRAETDLGNLEYIAETGGQKIFLKNQRKDPEYASESELTVHYYITLPEECPVYLKSHFGGATISNLRNQLRINGEYSAINIDNVQGLLDIRTRFGDITGDRIDGNVVINSRRSDIRLFDIGGTFTINAQYGELKLSPNRAMRDLRITADKSDVYIYEPQNAEGLAYEFNLNNGNIRLPEDRLVLELERTQEFRRVAIRPSQERSTTITASVTFGDLYLAKQTNEQRVKF